MRSSTRCRSIRAAGQVRPVVQGGDGAAGRQQQAGRRAVPEHRRRAVPGARPRPGQQRRRTSAPSWSPSATARRSTSATSPTVKEAPAVRFGAVTRNGQETVLGIALARINENAANVVEAVKAKLAIAQAALPKGVELKPVYDRTEIVDKALATAERRLDRRLDPGRDRSCSCSSASSARPSSSSSRCRWRCCSPSSACSGSACRPT